MSKAKLLLLIIITGLIALGVYLRSDEELSPAAVQWLEKLEFSKQDFNTDNAYIYLMGQVASPHDSVYGVGLERIKQSERAYKDGEFENHDFHLSDYKDTNPALNPNNTLICTGEDSRLCLVKYINTPDNARKTVEIYSDVLRRYKTMMAAPNYRTLNTIHILGRLPEYQYIMIGSRLALLEAIAQTNHSPQLALTLLQEDIINLRKQLALADTLIHKMVINRALSRAIDSLSLLFTNNVIPPSLVTPLVTNKLTPAELSMIKAMQGELAFSINTNIGSMALDKYNNDFTQWMLKFIYLPNATANLLQNFYEEVSNLSQSAPNQYLSKRNLALAENPGLHIKNIAGRVLLGIGHIDFREYTDRLFNLNNKLKLIRVRWANTADIDLSAPENSSPLDQSPPYYHSDEDGKPLICYKSLSDRLSDHCLMI